MITLTTEDHIAIAQAEALIVPLTYSLTNYDRHEIKRRLEWFPKKNIHEVMAAWISTREWFIDHGFHVAMTGGNCTAYGISITDDYYMLVTDNDGVDEPVFQDQLIYVGCYDYEGLDKGCETMYLGDFMEVWDD